MLRFLSHNLCETVVLLTSLTVGCGRADSSCTNRRCLAEMLIKKQYLSQPQSDNCTQKIHVPSVAYQTVSVDTKNLRLICRLQASLVRVKILTNGQEEAKSSFTHIYCDLNTQAWTDPELRWNTSLYPYDQVVLPVSKVWTPELHVTNGLTTTMKHSSSDLLVSSNGTVKHSVIINAEMDCEINLFNYPFASDKCPIAIQAWAKEGCGTELEFGNITMVDGSHGDWETYMVTLEQQRNDRNYIRVSLRIKYTNPFITLLLPSILIVLADVVSFALPLGGGERNSFKVTLVLSFTMFLIILNDQLPGDSQCSPIIRPHFCVCLVFLVLSMLVSMVLTRLAKDGSLVFCCFSKPESIGIKEEDEEVKADVSVVHLSGSEEDSRMLRKLVNFLEALDAQALQTERNQVLANKVDKTYFWFYIICGTGYFVGMTYTMLRYKCEVDHFGFWHE